MADLVHNGELHLFGIVGGDLYWDEGFTDTDVTAALANMSGPLIVRLNSPGGIVSHGNAIHHALADYDGEVTLYVEAQAYSAASVIAMAADTIIMRTGSMMMIHDPSSITLGNAEHHRARAEYLDKVADSVVGFYTAKSGQTDESVRAIMRKETWFTADEAVAAGFADRAEGGATMKLHSFDYSLFKHVPDSLEVPTPRKPAKQPVLPIQEASMAANTAQAGAEPGKNETNTTASVAPAAPANEPQMNANTNASPATPPSSQAAPKTEMSKADRTNLEHRCKQARLSTEDTLRVVMDSATLQDGIDMIFTKMDGGEPATNAPKGPTTMIIRDERETRREGLTVALSARLSGADPEDDKAHAYMDMTLPEMAATAVQQKDIRLTTFASRERALMSGFHATSDFPSIFENVLNKSLLDRYQDAEPTYRAISRQRNFRDFRPHSMVRAGDYPRLQTLGQGGEIKMGTFGENKETAIARPYAVQFAISREMMVNDDLGAIDEVLADQGGEVANFEERTFYAFMLAATTKLSDNQVVFHSSHNNLATSGTAITVDAVGAGRKAMRKQRSLAPKNGKEGRLINVTAKILLVSPDKETEAEQLVATVQPNQSDQVNPFSGKLQVISPAELDGNAWYLFADPSRLPNYVWGLLDGYEAPRARIDEPFGVQGMGFSLEHDFGLGAMDYRGAYKNPGA